MKTRWVSYVFSNPIFPWYVDGVHPGPLGAADLGQAVFEAISPLS
jgi:hypothetical protein